MMQQALQQRTRSESLAAVQRVLGPEPLTRTEIAERIHFSREAVRKALRRLGETGLATRELLEPSKGRPPYGWRRAEAATKGE